MAKPVKSFIKRNARVITITFSVILLFISINSFWIANNFYSSERFANNITRVLDREDVRLAIGSSVSEQLYQDNPVAGRVLSQPTQSLVASLLANDQFKQVFSNLAQNFNEYIVKADRQPVVIDLTGLLGIVRNVTDQINPEREQVIQADELKLVLLEPDDVPNLRGAGIAALLLGPYALLMLIIIFIVAWRKVDTKRELARLTGITFVIASAAILVVAWTEATLLSAAITSTNGDIIVRAIYDSFTGNLYTITILMGILGLLLIYVPKCWDWYQKKK